MSYADQMSDPKDGLSEVIAAHEATNAKLLLRVAELEAQFSSESHCNKLHIEEVTELREQVATLTEKQKDLEAELRGSSTANAVLRDDACELLGKLDAAKAELATLTQSYEAVKGNANAYEETLAYLTEVGATGHDVQGDAQQGIASLVEQRDAAKADAARLREALKKRHEHDFVDGPCDQPGHHKCDCWQIATAALSATDSAAWLESKIAERTTTLKDGIAQAVDDVAMLRAHNETLTQQLVAATNDAARAELRARDAVVILERGGLCCLRYDGKMRCKEHRDSTLCANCATQEFIAASPDSDERLRGVVRRALDLGYERGTTPSIRDDVEKDIDEVLRGGA